MASQKIASVRDALSRGNSELDELEELCQALSKSNAQLISKAADLEKRNAELEQSNKDHATRINMLQNTIELLEDDRRQLTRVSSIVNLEKQNQSLKKEIEQLHEKINRLLAAGQKPIETTSLEPEQPPEPPSDLFEKTIQGIRYLVDDEAFVYNKNADGTAGKRIGRLSKSDGKLSIKEL